MSSDEKTEDDFRSRAYQDVILQKCLEENTIVYLPTGAGKTFIAVQAIKHFAADLQRPILQGGKRSVFLTTTVALAKQQAVYISKITSLKVGHYSGDMDVDNWNKEKWFDEFDANQVIVATCQIILDVIRHGYLKLANLNVMVFDECHHGQKDHPMALLMGKFSDCPVDEHPRVIGLTGSLTKSSPKPPDVAENVYSLESTFRARVATASGAKAFDEVLMYSTAPIEQIIGFEPGSRMLTTLYSKIVARINTMKAKIAKWPFEADAATYTDKAFGKKPSTSDSFQSSLKDLEYHIENYGYYGGMLNVLSMIVEFELKKREADTYGTKLLACNLITELGEIYHIMSEQVYDDDAQMDDDPDGFNENTAKDDPRAILNNSTDQIRQLLVFLRKRLTAVDEPKVKSLIFVKRRISAKILCHIIRRFVNAHVDMDLKVDFMVGHNSRMPDSIETDIKNRNNSKVLEKFRRNEIDMIVATNVLEEGIDLQDCNLVVAFDGPEHYRAYVQMKGRARMTTSLFAIMYPRSAMQKLRNHIIQWTTINNILKQILVDRDVERPLPLEEDMKKVVAERVNDSYKTKRGAMVDYHSAISLLNRYVQTLPVDLFTKPVILWRKVEVAKPLFRVCLELPPQSSLREEIAGITTNSDLIGKRSAAFEACKRLHMKGLLNDHLLPINAKRFIDIHKGDYLSNWDDAKYANDRKQTAGTQKNNRVHDMKTPAQFIGSMPTTKEAAQLYRIEVQPRFNVSPKSSQSTEERENIGVFNELLQSNQGFGILTTKPLPLISSMTFFFSFGRVDCRLAATPTPIHVDDPGRLNALKRFHRILFQHVLEIWKDFLVFDNENSVIIVPTMGNQINWGIVDEFQQWAPLAVKSVAERTPLEYVADAWRHRVITPWYRPDTDVRYVVTRISSNEHPFSPFPNTEYKSYAAYVLEKYTDKVQQIVNAEQFLIQVKPLTRNLNILFAGDEADGGKRKSGRIELLIPELCHNFKFPGDLWLKALILPAFMHRLTYSLHAEELRLKINAHVGLRIGGYVPQPTFESMPKRHRTHERPPIQNPITYPRPHEFEAVELNMRNVEPMSKITERFAQETSEPADIERDFDKLYPVDIDYYYAMINGRLGSLSINEHVTALQNGTSPHRPSALCDVPIDDKHHINLLDLKLTSTISRGLEQHELLAAITTAKSADVFHMERFEVLGDAFLKFGISLYLLSKHSTWHEGNLTQMKSEIVGNRNLFYCGDKLGLPGMIKVQRFNPKNDWIPPMLVVDRAIKEIMKDRQIRPDVLYHLSLSDAEIEDGHTSENGVAQFVAAVERSQTCGAPDAAMLNVLDLQQVTDKTVADTVEAILGTCVKSIGIERAFSVLEMFGILPKRANADITNMLRFEWPSPRICAHIKDTDIDNLLTNYRLLEQRIGYTFKDRAYLLQALTHPSYPTNRLTSCYQQLEFLGDAVLDFLITAFIYERCPHMDPGQLTDLRSALVNNVTLACLTVRNNFHLHMLSQNILLTENIEKFVEFQNKQNHQVTEHVELLMEEIDVICRMAEYVDVPKALGDIFEAIIGAVFLDSGSDLLVTWKIIYRLMHVELAKFMEDVPIQLVRRLHEFPSANPEFDAPVVLEGKVMINLQFTCNGVIRVVHGFGDNKANAKKAASKVALLHLSRT